MFVTCILANFAADLLGWEWVYSLHHVTILCINVGKIDFLGKKYLPWGKFAEGKTPIIGVTFLVKKKNPDVALSCGPSPKGVNYNPRVELIAKGYKFDMVSYGEVFRNLLCA